MIAVDTNVLVRLIAKDDADQLALAIAYLRAHCSSDSPAIVNRIVLAELDWVLRKTYSYRYTDVATAIEGLLATAIFRLEDAPGVRAALARYRKGGVDFADALIGTSNHQSGASTTVTFDKTAAKRLDEFSLIT